MRLLLDAVRGCIVTLVFVAILWVLIVVGVGLDAWEVREQARADARRRSEWGKPWPGWETPHERKVERETSWRVACNCAECCAWRGRKMKGERLTLDVPLSRHTTRDFRRMMKRLKRKARKRFYVWRLRPIPRLTKNVRG